MNSNRYLLLWLVAITLLLHSRQAPAQQTTAFTYQGQLRDGGTNANGTYTMTFKLYNAASGGGQIGTAITNSPTLANGLFTANLDFGSAFDGGGRWLDITVQDGTNATETLAPRVQVLPTPYALYAGVAATVTNGAIMNAQLAPNAVNGPNIVGGQVVRSLNGLTDTVTLAAGANLSVFTNANALQFSASVPNVQVFTSGGTFVVPTNVTRIGVEIWGGGGAGGFYGCQNVTNGGVVTRYCNPGGGGGAGAYVFSVFSVTPNTSYTISTGAGGGSAGLERDGGITSFGGLMSAGGGSGGIGGGVNPGSGGAKGTASGGLLNVGGGNGLPGGHPTPEFGGWGGSAWRGPAAGNGGDGPAVGGNGGDTGGSPKSGHPGLVLVYY